MLALSVSISTSSSPLETSSPSDFSHLRIVPSSIESESRGIATSAIGSAYRGGLRRASCPGVEAARAPRRGIGDREAEGGAAARGRLDPDPAVVALDDPPADGEADPRAAGLRALAAPALEHLEHALRRRGVHADAVVGDAELPRPPRSLRADPHLERPL